MVEYWLKYRYTQTGPTFTEGVRPVEETALKAAECKSFRGSSPLPSASTMLGYLAGAKGRDTCGKQKEGMRLHQIGELL